MAQEKFDAISVMVMAGVRIVMAKVVTDAMNVEKVVSVIDVMAQEE